MGRGYVEPVIPGHSTSLDTLKCLSIGTPKTINFPFVPNGKLTVLSVPIFKHMILGM